jgi:hypothetical protein
MSETEFWRDCPITEVDPEIKHGRVVFKGTRFEVEEAIKDVLTNEELCGMSEDEAIAATLRSHPTIPGTEALRTVLAYESSREHLLVP